MLWTDNRVGCGKMRSLFRRLWNDPKVLLAVVAALLALVVQSGEVGSADAMHRLQTAHSFWTSEPAVFPNEYPEFGVHGRGGKLYDWYGMGQPVLMLPADIIGTYIERLPVFSDYLGSDPSVRSIFVTCTVNVVLNVLTALVCFRFLQLLGFNIRQSAAGVLALLFCTTRLHYTQNMMENNYILLLTLAGFRYQYEWLRTGRTSALIIGSGALGLNLLTRLTTGLDLLAAGSFLILTLWFEERLRREFLRLLWKYLRIAAPIYLFFLLIDRWYQFHRFGTWTDTYVRYFTIEHRLQDPTLPATYPWETPFHVGFLGPLFSSEKSIFLFDPLIVLTIVLCAFLWRRFNAPTKAFVAATLLLVFGYICLYARYTVWSGNFAWGDRYVSTAVELAGLIAVPLLWKFRPQVAKPVWAVGVLLIAVSFIIQLASLAFWLPLEIYQSDDLGHPQWIIWLRFKNIVAFALGKMNAWGLVTDSMGYDHWDYQHITTWNFLPWVLQRMGDAPKWVVTLTAVIWASILAGLCLALARMVKLLLRAERTEPVTN